MTTLFVDTNLLLHAKPLAHIPWEQRHERPVTIIITRTNIKELDKHKDQHPKRHIRERARTALQQFERSTTAPTLREGVTLIVDQRPASIDLAAHELDPESLDDQLIAKALAHQQAHSSETVILYTHDVGPRLTAQRLGINARELPVDDKLPPQKDETEVENDRLKRELHDLRTAAPQLHLTINDNDDSTVPITTLNPPPTLPSDDAITAQANAARDDLPTYPRAPAPSPVIAFRGQHPIDLSHLVTYPDAVMPGEHTRYDQERNAYADQYANYLRANHEALNIRARAIALTIAVHNDGGKPASDITIALDFPAHLTVAKHPPHLAAPPHEPRRPRTHQDTINDSLFRGPAIDYEMFRPPNLNPAQKGPWIEDATITWWVLALNHDFTREFDPIYTTLPDMTPFSVTYRIHAANSVTPFTRTIVIKPQQP